MNIVHRNVLYDAALLIFLFFFLMKDMNDILRINTGDVVHVLVKCFTLFTGIIGHI